MTTPTHLHPAQPIKLYRYPLSGNSHRVELFLSILGLPVELIDVDLAAGAQKTPAFLELNPLGQVPVIQDGGVTLADSNAILVYLANKYAAEQWLPRESYSHLPGQARTQAEFDTAWNRHNSSGNARP